MHESEDFNLDELLARSSAEDEPPARLFTAIGRVVEKVITEAIAEHERRYHGR